MASRTLTVISYGIKTGESYRVTLNPSNISTVISPETLVEIQGKALHKAVVTFIEEGSCELCLSAGDLRILEEAVGFYGLDEDFNGSF